MTLQWYGQSCFKLQTKTQTGEVALITDPYGPKICLKKPRLSADIVTISHNHEDHADYKSIKGTLNTPTPFLIKNPGEYEINNIFIYGIPAWHDNEQGKSKGPNNIYVYSIENINIVHLGDLGQKELSTDQLEFIKDIDILLIPVGGKYTINAKEAATLISQIEPRIVIPMHYKIPNLKVDIDPVDKFIKEMGNNKEELDKLKISKKDLPQEETKLIILKP